MIATGLLEAEMFVSAGGLPFRTPIGAKPRAFVNRHALLLEWGTADVARPRLMANVQKALVPRHCYLVR